MTEQIINDNRQPPSAEETIVLATIASHVAGGLMHDVVQALAISGPMVARDELLAKIAETSVELARMIVAEARRMEQP